MSPAIDLASIESRQEIRRAVHRGDVEVATEMVNELDPEVSLARAVFIPPLSPLVPCEEKIRRRAKIKMYYAPLSGSFEVVMTSIRSR